jgi:prepilin-type N-terminal cleavage/methylation domain-containing protein
MRHVRLTPRRAGVTLIELLIVMMIIAILASLSLSAVFTVREAQMKSFTESLINKLASAMDGQWKAALDQIREEPVPAWATQMAGGDAGRARVIYTKARLKQEFPVTFYQAIYPNANYAGGTGAYQTSGGAADLPPKDAYRRAVVTLVPAMGATILPPDSGLPPSPGQPSGFESSVLLYLTLAQGRRGQAGFNADEHVEPTAIKTATVNGVQLKYFVDSWGNPVRYYAFPFYNDELNQSPYFSAIQNQQSPDPQDPDQTMFKYATLVPTWPGKFQAMLHPPIHPVTGQVRVLTPVIASAGRDGAWGLNDFDMTVTALNDTNDNIYSYRLRRSGARGD